MADDDDSGDELSNWLDRLISPEEMAVYSAQDEFEPFTVSLPGRLLGHLLELKARYTDEIAREDAGELVEETCPACGAVVNADGPHTGHTGSGLMVVEIVEEILASLIEGTGSSANE